MEKIVQRPRLLVLTERFHPEPFLVNELIADFVANGFDVTVLTQAPSYPHDRLYPGYQNRLLTFERFRGARVIRVRTVLGYRRSLIRKLLNYVSFSVLTSIALLGTRTRYDSVFVNHTGPLTQAVAAYFIQGQRSQRVIWTQDVWPDTVIEYGLATKGLVRRLLDRFVRSVYRRFGTIAVTSPGFIAPIRRTAPRQTIMFAPQWVPAAFNCHADHVPDWAYKRPGGAKTLFRFAGNIGSMQNLEIVIRAFGAVAERVPDLWFEIIGDGSERESLEQVIRERNVRNVFFRGAVPMEAVHSILEQADFLVLPLVGVGTVSRTIPAKFQAYLQVGRPMLVVMSGTVPQIVTENQLGVCATPDDLASICDAILELVSWEDEKRSLASAASRRVLEETFRRENSVRVLLRGLESAKREGQKSNE